MNNHAPHFRHALLLCATLLWAPLTAHAQAADFAHFDVASDGDTIHLLTGQGKKGVAEIPLFHRLSKDGGATWSKPVRVNRDTDRLSAQHPGENPSIVAAGSRVVVAWSAPRANTRRGGLIATMLSDDGGATWKPGPSPFEDAAGSQTFMRMTAAGTALHMVWLDSRDGRQGLRYARSADGSKSWVNDVALAPRTCDCCWNSIATRPDGEVSVLYRGGDPRDMLHMASKDGSTWQKPVSIGGFDWRVSACPHVGGALAVQGQVLHSLVWTGKEDVQGLYHASLPAGGTWSKPRRLGTEDAKNADLAPATDGSLVAVWDERSGRGSPLRMARSRDGGASWGTVETIPANRDASHPRVVATSRGTLTLWFEGQPWSGAKLMANGRAIESAAP